MKAKEKYEKNLIKNIFVIIIMTCVILLVSFAYAKYITTINGNTNADIAKWNFNVTGDFFESTNPINFATTREDGNNHVSFETIAPGTSGKFEIGINTSGTETNLIYEVNIQFTQKPKNLKIYIENKKEVNIVNNVISYKKFLTYTDAQTTHNQTFYWEWPLETGNTEKEIRENDIDDSNYINQTMFMNITVIGTQTNMAGANILYNGNGATNYAMFSEVVLENTETNLAENAYKKIYEVNLETNGGIVENDKVISEYEFSHWSTDDTNENVLYFSNEEKVGRKSSSKFTRIYDICKHCTIY